MSSASPDVEPAPLGRPARSRRWLAWLRWVMGLGIAGWLAARIARDAPRLLESLVMPSAREVLIALASSVGALLLLAVAWRGMARSLGLARDLDWAGWLRVWLQPYFYRYVPGKVALAAERVRLGRLVGVDATTSLLLLLWESLLLVISAGVVVAALLGARGLGASTMTALVASVAAAVAGVAALPRVLAFSSGRGWLRRLGDLRRASLSRGAQARAVLTYAGVWLCFGYAYAVLAAWFAPAARGQHLTLTAWFVVAWATGFVTAVAPGGLGVREAVLVMGTSPLLGESGALAAALGSRLWMTIVELLVVGASLLARLPAEAPARGEP